MKAKTKERLKQLHAVYENVMPDQKGVVPEEEFVFLSRQDDEIYFFAKNAPDRIWDEFIKSMEKSNKVVEKFKFDWSCLTAWYNDYIAMNEDGSWYSFTEMPVLDSQSLTKNPNKP